MDSEEAWPVAPRISNLFDAKQAPLQKVKMMYLLDRRINVAPMMDWTDSEEILSGFASLQALQNACRLYVASARS